jgi:hypothetical protein
MKKTLIILAAATGLLIACSKGPASRDASIVGRWNVVGFEETVLYEFTDSLRYTIYSTNGVFGPLDSAIPGPHHWELVDDTVVIDLNFGNESRLYPRFDCKNNVIDWINADGSVHSTYFSEGISLDDCN